MLNIAFVLAVVLVTCLTFLWYRKPKHFPPGPRGLPILGIIPYLGKFPERQFGAWGKKYGPLMSVPMGWQNWIVLNDYDIIVETLVKRSEEFNERPYVRFFCAMTSNGIVFVPGGSNWFLHRKFAVSTIRRFGGSKGVMERKIVEEARYFTGQLETFEGKPFQIQKLLTNAVSNVICNIAFGKRYDYNDAKFQHLVGCLLKLFELSSHWMTNLLMALPFLCDVPPFSLHVAESVGQILPIRDMINELLEDHMSCYDPNDIRDIMDAYLETFLFRDKNFDLKNCQDCFVDVFLAGTDTSASTLRWALLCLMLHQDVQESMHDEIDRVIGREGTPSSLHREEMPYTCAVVHEILRFRTLAALSLPRCTSTDVTVRGYRMPKGTKIMTNLWHVHNDDTYWKDPGKFSPQRHLDADGNFTNSRHVIPFGAGARVCPGEQLARAEQWIFLVSIIQKFRVSVDPNSPDKPSLDRGSSALVYIPETYDMILTVRP